MKSIIQKPDLQADQETVDLLRKLRTPRKLKNPVRLQNEIADFYQKIGYSKEKSRLLGKRFITRHIDKYA